MSTLFQTLREHLSWDPKPDGDYRAWIKMQLSRLSCGFTEYGFDCRCEKKFRRARVAERVSSSVSLFHYHFLMNAQERRYDDELRERMQQYFMDLEDFPDQDPET